MLTHDELYQEIVGIGSRYPALKKHFDSFSHLAERTLTAEKSAIRGFRFAPDLDRNYFDVFFAGRRIRFSFFMEKSVRGFVEVYLRDLVSGDCRDKVGSFAFGEKGETDLRSPGKGGDNIHFSENERAAGFVLLHFVHEAINKEVTPYIKTSFAGF